jgi:hypothetical protein
MPGASVKPFIIVTDILIDLKCFTAIHFTLQLQDLIKCETTSLLNLPVIKRQN